MERQSEIDWYIRAFVLSSLLLQVALYFLPPLRRTTRSKRLLYLISILFPLSSWIPSFTLLLICSRAIYGYEYRGDYKPPLILWASLMSLHIAGHGQERQTPYLLQMNGLRKGFSLASLAFLFFNVVVIIYLLWSWREIPKLVLPVLILACARTFSKLQHTRDQIKEVEGLITSTHGEPITRSDEGIAHELFRIFQKLFWLHDLSVKERQACSNFFRNLACSQAIRIIEVELSLIYHKFYGRVLPSKVELVLMSLFPALVACYTISCQADRFSVVRLVSLSLSIMSKPILQSKVSPLLFLSWYAYTACERKPRIHGLKLKELHILVDSYIIDVTALICTHQLVVHLWLMKQRSVVDHEDDHQSQSSTETSSFSLSTSVVDHEDDHQSRSSTKSSSFPLTMSSLESHHQPKRPSWSGTIPRFNLLLYGVREPRNVSAFIRCLLNTWPVSSTDKHRANSIGLFIFKQLEEFHHDPTKARSTVSAMGQSILRQGGYQDLVDHQAPFEDIVLRWHLATGILYHTENASTSSTSIYISNQDKSMVLSDYMGYLLIVQPWIMSKLRKDTFRKSLHALSEIIGLIHSSNMKCYHKPQTEEMQLKEIYSKMQSIYNTRENQTDHIKKVVQSLSKIQMSLRLIFSQISGLLNFREEQQPLLTKEKNEKEQTTRKEQLLRLPKGENWFRERTIEGQIREAVQSLAKLQLSLSKMSHFLSLQDAKDEQLPPVPKEKDMIHQTTREKQPPQPPRGDTKYLHWKRERENHNRKVVQSLSLMQLYLSKMSQILSIQYPSEEQHKALTKDMDEKDQTKTLVLDKRQLKSPREKNEENANTFVDWIKLALDCIKEAEISVRKMSRPLKDKYFELHMTSAKEKDNMDQETFNWINGTWTPVHITAVQRSLSEMEQSFKKLLHILSFPDSTEERTRRPNEMDQSKSLVHDAHDLAAKIKSSITDTDKMWRIIAKVWVEMLAYACIHSDPRDHIRSLSQGGELASIVWLYMLPLEFREELLGIGVHNNKTWDKRK